MSALCLAEKLNIRESEQVSLARQLKCLLMVHKERNLREEYMSRFYEEWMQLGRRLNKGGHKIQEMATKRPPEELAEDPRFNDLVNLYQFLMGVLGLYDEFFRLSVPRSDYEAMRSSVLETLLSE